MIDSKLVEQARNADMIGFLAKYCGFTFASRRGVYRCKQHPSLAIKNDRLSWFWHSKGIGGYGALDYLMRIENTSFRAAVEALTGIDTVTLQPRQETEQPITLFFPEKAGIPLRLYDYLCRKRGIDSEIVNKLIQEEKIYEDRRGNVVFVAYDENNKPRFASVRGTYDNRVFRMDCIGSDKRYGFNMTYSQSKRLYIFESPIDAMSHASLRNATTGNKDAWKHQNRLSLAGTSDIALPKHLETRPFIEELVFCLDNDPAGREASRSLVMKYRGKGFNTWSVVPTGKDFNEDLMDIVKQRQLDKAQQHKVKDNPCL